MDAYRAETFGLYCILLLLHNICTVYNITEGTIEIACNCLSSLTTSIRNIVQPNSTQKDFDLICAIYNLRKSLPIKIKIRHIQGHQDNQNKQLEKWESLNCECYHEAKYLMNNINTPLPPS